MIKVSISRVDGVIRYINILGHADYDDYGKDIVCASVSSIVITTINATLTFNKDYIKYIQKEDDFNIEILEVNEVTINLFNNMFKLLQELSEGYPGNIEIKEEE